jgi:hypothetical protein
MSTNWIILAPRAGEEPHDMARELPAVGEGGVGT